eukprot:5963385-Prymnesium_polylepis.2
MSQTPLGVVRIESTMRGGVQKLGRLGCLDTLITYSLGLSALWDLRGFDREVMSLVRGRSRGDGFGCVTGM